MCDGCCLSRDDDLQTKSMCNRLSLYSYSITSITCTYIVYSISIYNKGKTTKLREKQCVKYLH